MSNVIRKYNAVDMLRMAKFARENQKLTGMSLLRSYNRKFPELSSKQQLANVFSALDMPNEYKKITGENLPAT